MHRKITAVIALTVALSPAPIQAARRPETDADPACASARAGDACVRGQSRGACQPGQCCHSNYQNLQANGAPTQVCQPCLTCQVPLAPLQPLVLPPDDPTATLPQAVTVVEPAQAPSTAVAEAEPPTPTTGRSGVAEHHGALIGIVAILVAAAIGVGAFFLLRNRSAGDK